MSDSAQLRGPAPVPISGLRSRRWKPLCLRQVLAAACLVGLVVVGPVASVAAPVHLATHDGLALTLNDHGAVESLRVKGRELLRPGMAGGLFLADVAPAPVQDDELLRNPGFEQLEKSKPVGWTFGSEWTVDRTRPHSGKICMKLLVPGPDKKSSSSLAATVSVKPNTPYRVSLWMRTQNCAPALYIEQYDAEGKQRAAYPQITVSHSRKNSDWFQLKWDFTTAPFCRRIRVRTSLWRATGTAWVDDASVTCLADDYLSLQKPVTGQLRRTSDGARFRGVAEGVQVEARYLVARDHVRVHCELLDLAGRDRAVSFAFRLPLAAQGWTWYDDLHNSQRIEAGLPYGSARLFGPRRTIALYPFSTLGDARTSLALAVTMDQPRVFTLGYEDRFGYFVTYEFGLTRDTAKFPGRASFDFLLYRTDPRWGFRSAADRYYRLFPQFFTRRVVPGGPAGFMPAREVAEAPGFIFPSFIIFNYWHRPLDLWRRELVKAFSYTEFAGWWGWALGIKPEQAKKKPSYEEAWAYVEKLARGEVGKEDQQKVARCVLNCSPYDREGKRQLHTNYVPQWGGYNYICNPDPEVTGRWGGVNRFKLTYDREVSKVKTFGLEGLYFDCVFVFVVDNFRREHFRWADEPLAFDHLSKRPVLPLAFSIYEAAKAFADDMHGRGKLVMANYSVTRHPTDLFCIQFIDIIGNEMLWTWCTDAKLSLQRTLAYQKTVSMSWQEAKKDWPAKRVEAEMKQAMAYGTFYYISHMDLKVWNRWAPVIRRLSSAGWEPITLAHVDDPAVKVERFGSVKARTLHFTLRNDTAQARQVKLSLDGEKLGLGTHAAQQIWMVEGARQYTPAASQRQGKAWQVILQVPARDTVVLRIADRLGLVCDQLAPVPEQLEKAANYARALRKSEEQGGPGGPAEELERLAGETRQLLEALTRESADARGLAARLAAVDKGLSKMAMPSSSGEKGEKAFLTRKLKEHLAEASHAIARAAELLETK